MRLQEAIDDYLAKTGRDLFLAGEFRDWLAERPTHPLYQRFLGETQEEAARKWQVHKIRMAVAGLRITVRYEEPQRVELGRMEVREYPALHSPVETRCFGGGYQVTDPQDTVSMLNLRAEGLVALRAWLNRYGSVFGADAKPVEDMINALGADE